MRLNMRSTLLFLCCAVAFVTLTLWSKCAELSLPRRLLSTALGGAAAAGAATGQRGGAVVEEIDCVINQEYSVSCRREGDEVYLPFSFLHDYFEVYGSLSTVTNSNGNANGAATDASSQQQQPPLHQFDWSHSNAKVNYPKGAYDPRGIFMYFENYNVEMRDRVKCIGAADGVPLSTQWEPLGNHYPTQIAQFGLAHFSKNLTEPEPRRRIVEDGDENVAGEWLVPAGSNLTRAPQRIGKTTSTVLQFETAARLDAAVTLALDHVLDLVLGVDVLLRPNSSLTVAVQNRESLHTYQLHYVVSDVVLAVQEDNFYYGMGANASGGWKRLTRDIVVDLQKGMQASVAGDKRKKHRRTELKITAIKFHGSGAFDNLTLATSEHIAQFYDAAEWFVRHQHPKTGGWPNPVKRKLAEFNELKKGWYSAMGQGHAISLLARAYHHSGGDQRFLTAAVAALKPFRVPARQGGVLAKFMGKFDWYEEYPTKPASFVLNGFIYSLLGLYDLNATVPAHASKDAAFLYAQGMQSLKKMLVLFDTGSGSIYDLRHFTLGVGPNIARWDYHATHVNQLLLLATIDGNPLIARTAERWRSYMVGKRAAHN